eukprot:UN26389
MANECASMCRSLNNYTLCMEEDEDCVRQNKGEPPYCMSINAPCSSFKTSLQCGNRPTACQWEELGEGCISVSSTCDKFFTDNSCSASTFYTCNWDEDFMRCQLELESTNKSNVGESNREYIERNYLVLLICMILICSGGICFIIYCLKLSNNNKYGDGLYFFNSNNC